MGKKKGIIVTTAVLSLIGLASVNNNEINTGNVDAVDNELDKIKICDGINIVNDCEFDGIMYSIYKYYEAVPEQSHIETITTYTKEIVGYCTLCRDGSWSPTCATGRGACSHHGGVAEYNSPIYSDVPHYEQKKIIDVEYRPERWEKVVK